MITRAQFLIVLFSIGTQNVIHIRTVLAIPTQAELRREVRIFVGLAQNEISVVRSAVQTGRRPLYIPLPGLCSDSSPAQQCLDRAGLNQLRPASAGSYSGPYARTSSAASALDCGRCASVASFSSRYQSRLDAFKALV